GSSRGAHGVVDQKGKQCTARGEMELNRLELYTTRHAAIPASPRRRPRSWCQRVITSARYRLGAGLVASATLASLTSCAVNPATGARQFTLYSEAQEIEMGREYDPQIVAEMGLYPDESLQRYIQELGSRLAERSERPHLPWTF